ncbi:tetratricopeptide repeat protein [Candidatus Gottesmanbacteria bacterium]|nr:tetratricopeptide repeat protein [Candidatus Gottesmanbacteria bacterium]
MKSLTLSNVMQFFVITTLSILPLFFLPITSEFYETNKWYLLAFTALLVSALWVIQSFKTGKLTVHLSPSTLAFGALALASLASLLFVSQNKVDALLSLYGVVPFAAIFFLLLFGEPSLTKKGKTIVKNLWYAGAAAAGLMSLYQFFALGKVLAGTFPFLSDSLWTPVGSSLALICFLLLPLPLLVEDIVNAIIKKEETQMAILIAASLLLVTGLGITLFQVAPKILASFLPYSTGWTVMMEGFKNIKRAMVGVGVENFLFAFSSGKPTTINMTPLWNLRFITSSSFVLHFVTTMGLVGAAALVLLVKSLFPTNPESNKKSYGITGSLIAALLVLFLIPPNFVTLVLLLTLSVLYHEPEEHTKTVSLAPVAFSSILIVTILGIGVAFYSLGRAYASEIMFNRSLVAAQAGNGTNTYNFQREAVILAPSVTRYHTTYAQTNLALANTLAANLEKQGPKASGSAEGKQQEEDRKLITTLIQQSIQQAKVATTLAPENVSAWENLGQTYTSLIGVASGAQSWAVASYERAIQLESANPVLRVTLGGLHLRQGNFDEAISLFSGAVSLKPDYANGYYNLANAYRLKGNKDLAIQAYEAALKYTPQDSSDLDKVKTELENLKNQPATPPPPTKKTAAPIPTPKNP